MKIELRKVDYSASLSEETNAFSVEVWISGKKEGWAQNHGRAARATCSRTHCARA